MKPNPQTLREREQVAIEFAQFLIARGFEFSPTNALSAADFILQREAGLREQLRLANIDQLNTEAELAAIRAQQGGKG